MSGALVSLSLNVSIETTNEKFTGKHVFSWKCWISSEIKKIWLKFFGSTYGGFSLQ